MALKSNYATKEEFEAEVAEQYRDLYTEKAGKYDLTGIAGVRGAAEFSRIDAALKAERSEHTKTKAKLAKWGEHDPDEVIPKLDNLDALIAQAGAGDDKNKVAELVERQVEARIKGIKAPLERQLREANEALKAATGEVSTYKAKDIRRAIRDAVDSAMVEMKVRDEAREDVRQIAESIFEVGEDGAVRTRDQVGVTPGIDPKGWILEVQPKKPHWWPPSQGGGAPGSRGGGGGGGGENPWARENWNVTKQGEYVRKHGAERAAQAARAVGSSLGATQPPEKK